MIFEFIIVLLFVLLYYLINSFIGFINIEKQSFPNNTPITLLFFKLKIGEMP